MHMGPVFCVRSWVGSPVAPVSVNSSDCDIAPFAHPFVEGAASGRLQRSFIDDSDSCFAPKGDMRQLSALNSAPASLGVRSGNAYTLLLLLNAARLIKLDKRAAEAAPILGIPSNLSSLHHSYRPFQIRPQDRAVEWRDHREARPPQPVMAMHHCHHD